MTPTTCASIIANVVNDVVVTSGANAAWDLVSIEVLAQFPSDIMIGTGAITTNA